MLPPKLAASVKKEKYLTPDDIKCVLAPPETCSQYNSAESKPINFWINDFATPTRVRRDQTKRNHLK
jgi:hypothetical protein